MNKKISLLLLLCGSILLPTRSSFAADMSRANEDILIIDAATKLPITTREAAIKACYMLKKKTPLLNHVVGSDLTDFLEEKMGEILSFQQRATSIVYPQIFVFLRYALRHFGNPIFKNRISLDPCFLIKNITTITEFDTQLYLEAGARANLANEHGLTALHIAALHGMAITANCLIKGGANVHARAYIENATPLHMLATTYNHQDKDRPSQHDMNNDPIGTLHVLVKRGANLHALDSRGRKPLDVIHESIEAKFGEASPAEIALRQAFESATAKSVPMATAVVHDTEHAAREDDPLLTADD